MYLANYEEGWQGLGEITEMPIEQFREWVGDGQRKTEPVAYVSPEIPEPEKIQGTEAEEEAGAEADGEIRLEGPSEETVAREPIRAIMTRIQGKYSDILSIPEVEDPQEGPVGDVLGMIDEGTATPEDVRGALMDAAMDGEEVLESAKNSIRAVVADKTGNLQETYRYESTDEGEAMESYIDSLLRETDSFVPPSPVPDIERAPEVEEEPVGELPGDRGIEPWQMTADDYVEERVGLGHSGEGARIGHRSEVQDAISDGQFIPKDVLADYPDLVAPEEALETPADSAIPEETGSPLTKMEKSLKEYTEYVDSLTEEERAKAGDLIVETPGAPSSLKLMIQKAISEKPALSTVSGAGFSLIAF